MHSYNNLWEKIIDEENIRVAIHKATQGKFGKRKKKRQKKYCLENIEALIPQMKEYAEKFHHFKHREINIYDGIRRKERVIIIPSLKEQILHHMIINILKPIFLKSMYKHSYGSIPNRGGFLGKKYIEKWIKKDVKNTKYVLKMDIKKYFDNVSHKVLKEKLSKLIRDKKLLYVLNEIIDTIDKGIPLGFYTSQWFANFYLTSLDHYIKEQLGATYYIRYMDDMVILGSNKRKLHEMRRKILEYLNKNLELDMKENWQVFKLQYIDSSGKAHGRDIDFMGFRFYRHKTILRKSILMKMKRKVRHLKKKRSLNINWTVHDARAMLSYLGWIKVTDIYKLYKREVKPFVSFKRLKRMVSIYDNKKNNKEMKSLCGKNPKILTV